MHNKYQDVIELVKNYKTYQEISKELALSKYELTNIFYKIVNKKIDLKISKDIELFLQNEYLNNVHFINLKNDKVAIISDTHIGSKTENIEYLNKIKHFLKENDINILLHGGDIGDGTVKAHKKYQTCLQQIDHIIDTYPSDKNITQYLLAGNHDERYLKKGFDILKILEEEKKNIIGIGYFQAYFKVYDKIISFEHNSKKKDSKIKDDFIISGHSHTGMFLQNRVKIPTASDDHSPTPDTIDSQSGFLTLETSKDKNVNLLIKRYIFTNDNIEENYQKKYILK